MSEKEEEEREMVQVMVVHEVQDPERWLKAWTPGPGSRREMFQQHGAPRVRVYQDPDNPRLTGLLIDVENLEAFQTFMASPEAASAKAEDGVKSDTMKVLGEVTL